MQRTYQLLKPPFCHLGISLRRLRTFVNQQLLDVKTESEEQCESEEKDGHAPALTLHTHPVISVGTV